MERVINVKNIIGENFTCCDAVLLKNAFKSAGNNTVIFDFKDIHDVPTTFFYNLFSDVLYNKNRNNSFENIRVRNLSSIENFNRVVKGTTFLA